MVRRNLVLYDYGTGGLWWWIDTPEATTDAEIVDRFEGVMVVHDEHHLRSMQDEGLQVVPFDGPYPPGLDLLAEHATTRRNDPGATAP